MPFRWYFSIRTKILFVLVAVVIPAVGMYLWLASRITFEDKTLLIYELNQTNVRTLGDGVEARLGRIVDKLRVVGRASADRAAERLARDYLKGEKDFARVVLLKRDGKNKIIGEAQGFLENYGQTPKYFDRVRATVPVPFDRVIQKGTWVASATLTPKRADEEVPPLMTVAVAIDRNQLVYADVRTEGLLEIFFASGGLAATELVDSDGYRLAHSNQKRVLAREKTEKDPLIQAAAHSKVRLEVKRFEDDGVSYLGSFYRLGLAGLIVASRIEQGEAFAAARILMKKSALYALAVISAAFLIALFFAHSLTVPIQKLVAATRLIAQGDFNLLVPVHVGRGDELSILASSFNSMTSDLKTSREQIEEYSRDLEKKVADRTVVIRETQEALVRTTRLASVGEVAGRAAHEVLNPLTNISTRLERLQAQSLESQARDLQLMREIVGAWEKDYREKGVEGLGQSLKTPSQAMPGKLLVDEDLTNLNAIAGDSQKRLDSLRSDIQALLKECGRISKIVNGMRQLTRVSGNRRRIDVHKIIDESFESVSDLLTKHKVKGERFFSQGSPQFYFDHDEWMQIMNNLIRNSLQALQQARNEGKLSGDPKIWVTTQTVAGLDGKKQVVVRVCDNGPGIAPENFTQIFEPSFTTKTMEEGTGLGLSICRRFVRAYDGEIELEKSEPGTETCFVITLPEASSEDTP